MSTATQRRPQKQAREDRLGMGKYFTSACLAALVMAPAVARAADEADGSQDAKEASAIVVTGRGLDDGPAVPVYDVQTLDRRALRNTASGRIEDALSAIAGFQQFRRSDSRSANPSAQGVTLRALGGNATSRALVLLDGVPMADPFFGYVPLSALAPERLASARITRGGGSGAFGAGAVAGTIELISANADEMGLFNGAALVDDRGETELSGTLAPKLGDGFAMITGRWDRGRGFWTTPADQRVAASTRASYDSWSTGARFVAPLAPDTEIQARASTFRDTRTLRFDGADSLSEGSDASLRVVGHGHWGFDVLGYGQLRNFSNIVISSSSFTKTLDQYKTPTLGYGGKIELRPPIGAGRVLRLGADLRVADGNEQEASYNPGSGAVTVRKREGGRNSDFGLFAEGDWTLGPAVLSGGARADRWSIADGSFVQTTPAGAVTVNNPFPNRSDWEATFHGGARFNLSGALALRAAAYTGFRLPTLNELYRPFIIYPVTTLANAALKPERLRGFEAGIDLVPAPGITLSLTAFDDRLRDAIANVTLVPNKTRERQNVGAIHAQGLEFTAGLALGQVSFDSSLALTHSRAEAPGQPFDGKRPAQTPGIAASATLGWRPRPGWDAALTLRHVGAQYEDDLETDLLPAATTLNAFLALPLAGPLSLVLRGENLTDTTVITRNQAGSIDLGVPRTLWIGFRIKAR